MQKNFNVTVASIMRMRSDDSLNTIHKTGVSKCEPKEIFLLGVFDNSVLESGGYDSCFKGMDIFSFLVLLIFICDDIRLAN